MRKLLKNMCPRIAARNNEPADQEFFEHFKTLACPITAEYFDYDYEKSAAEFIKKYDEISSPPIYDKLEYDCMNSNFTKLEIEAAIDYLKYDEGPGADYVPAEFIKSGRSVIADDITEVFNYIIEKKKIPDLWTEGIRSAVHKGGAEKLVDNYQGITILPIMEKVFEILLNPLSPKLKFHIFDTLIRPVLTYGSDVWGHRKSGLTEIDRVFMRYVRCILNVNATTSNVIVIGECGRYPSSVFCHISLLCFFNRMYHMSDTKLAKQVYCELLKLHENGFPNWISNVTELSKLYEIDIFGPRHNFNQQCTRAVTEHHIKEWRPSLNDVKSHPILKTYNLIKTRCGTELHR